MTKCPVCGADVPEGAKWCPSCHSNLINPGAGRLASPGRRFMAFLIDGVLVVLLFSTLEFFAELSIFSIFLSIFMGADMSAVLASAFGWYILSALWLGLFTWVVYELARGRSIGKRLLKMRVVREDGRSTEFCRMLLREFVGKYISLFYLGLGFLSIIFDRNRQGWHDKLADTYVVEEG